MANDNKAPTYRLDPRIFPKRIELELTDKTADKINAIAEKTGRSFSEVATDILSRNGMQ